MSAPALTLLQLGEDYAVSRLPADSPIPQWADGSGFVSISRSADELSIVCPADRVPAGLESAGPWTCFKLLGPFPFDATGIALSVIEPLSRAEIGIFLVSTFDTDYLLVKAENAESARSLLSRAGHSLIV